MQLIRIETGSCGLNETHARHAPPQRPVEIGLQPRVTGRCFGQCLVVNCSQSFWLHQNHDIAWFMVISLLEYPDILAFLGNCRVGSPTWEFHVAYSSTTQHTVHLLFRFWWCGRGQISDMLTHFGNTWKEDCFLLSLVQRL